ncbi:MAG: sigma-70 family RNA polymerase sigma factor [Acidobacteriaceae bacterium]|jgi:RNA polymerase sigma-70 factor, ECF subfamily
MMNTMSNTSGNMPLLVPPGQLAAQRDEQLVSAAKAGSNEAFAELQSLYTQRLYNTIIRITKNHEDAEDALQDTFLRVHLALCGFEGRSSFYSWVTRIAMNSALMVLRKRRARPEVSFDLPSEGAEDLPHFEIKDSSPNPEQIYYERQQWLRMLRSIHNLQPKLQEAIRIRMASECSRQEIATTLGISVASVKSRLYRARVRLGSQRIPANRIDPRRVSSRVQRERSLPSMQNREPLRMDADRHA